jgi:hypothetical protein
VQSDAIRRHQRPSAHLEDAPDALEDGVALDQGSKSLSWTSSAAASATSTAIVGQAGAMREPPWRGRLAPRKPRAAPPLGSRAAAGPRELWPEGLGKNGLSPPSFGGHTSLLGRARATHDVAQAEVHSSNPEATSHSPPLTAQATGAQERGRHAHKSSIGGPLGPPQSRREAQLRRASGWPPPSWPGQSSPLKGPSSERPLLTILRVTQNLRSPCCPSRKLGAPQSSF